MKIQKLENGKWTDIDVSVIKQQNNQIKKLEEEELYRFLLAQGLITSTGQRA